MKFNKNMDGKFKNLKLDNEKLPVELAKFFKEGFIEKDGCIFLKYLIARNGNGTLDKFPDKTGFECFVNSFHIDDHVSDEYIQNVLLFIAYLFFNWKQEKREGRLQAFFCQSDVGGVLKFHLLREGETWRPENLEEYGEVIFRLTSED